jgi:hypothetical protein
MSLSSGWSCEIIDPKHVVETVLLFMLCLERPEVM